MLEYSENNPRIIPKIVKKNAGKPFGKSMKIGWTIDEKSMEIYENSMEIELGGVLGALGASWGALLASFSVLGVSWERLGASLGRPGDVPEPNGIPTWTIGWAQNG